MGPLPSESPALAVGSYTHAILAAHYARQLPDARYPGFRPNCPSPDDVIAALTNAGADLPALQVAERLWSGYQDKWGDDGWQPVAVEMPVGNPLLHTARFDMLVHVDDGTWRNGLWICEHKSASPASDLEMFQLDGEIMGEMMAFKMDNLEDVFGARLAGVVVNALVKSKTPAYHRLWIPVNWELVNDFAKNRGQLQADINFRKKSGLWIKNHYGCTSRYDKCMFWEHCRTLNDSMLSAAPKKDAT
jgi:hypothetical protein